MLYLTNLIAETAGVPVFSLKRQMSWGSVSASVNGPLAFKQVDAEQEDAEQAPDKPPTLGPARLVWLPEGLVITPRTPGAPDGFGMPPTPNGRGTPGGPLSQVIINRFAENQYPDAVYRRAGGADGNRVFAANLFFMDWEMTQGELGIGLTLDVGGKPVFMPQFNKRWAPLVREPDSGVWHCHRPQVHLQESAMEALIRQETNLIREQFHRPPLGLPLRGTTGELSQNIAYQIRRSGVVEHDSPEFREGHRTFQARVEERSGFLRTGGENLNLQYPADLDASAVRYAMLRWYNSPGHRANMLDDWAEGGICYSWIDPALTAAGKAVTLPGVDGALGVQIFHGAAEWVSGGAGTHEDRPPVTVVEDQNMFVSLYPGDESSTEFWPLIAYRGRVVYLTAEAVNVHAMVVLSGTTLVEEGAETKLRVAVLHRPQGNDGLVFFVIYEGLVHDFLATRKEIARYQLPKKDANFIARPRWSASGAKAIFCYTTLGDVPAGCLGGLDGFTPVAESSGVLGQTLHFMEFRGGALYDLGAEQLTITPLEFGKAGSVAWYSQECRGSCRLLADYQGETPVFARIEVDGQSSQSGASYSKRFKGTLHFPNGQSLTYVDLRTNATPGDIVEMHGFVRHLLPFDIQDPDGVAYLQYDLPEDNASFVTGTLMIRGTPVMFAQDPLQRGPGLYRTMVDNLNNANQITTMSAHRGATDAVSFFTRHRYARAPITPYPAVVVSYSQETAPRIMPRGNDYLITGLMEYVLAGPVILRDGVYDMDQDYERVEQYRCARYKGEWLYAGRIESTLGGVGTRWGSVNGQWTEYPVGAWLGDDQYYCHSSLNLKAIAGLPDLKNNILPIGVL